MPTTYSGNPAVFPAAYDIPSDGDDENASSVNAGLEALGDRTAYLKAQLEGRTVFYLLGTGNLVPALSSHVWNAASGSYVVANQLGIVDSIFGDIFNATSSPPGVIDGDILQLDVALNVDLNYTGGPPQIVTSMRMMVSETAADFVTGSWAMIEGNAQIAQRDIELSASASPLELKDTVTWSFQWRPVSLTGHVRFAIAADCYGLGENATLLNLGGRWSWWRSA